ncbi:MAG: C39 family peptidase [Candidatus Aureabacteria bacterium]|nr:C39 family peptidase [Candidatus Auribacterota bacterium]MCK5161272.1 C39 family peptidase [Candidatus Auribacterota bacterium]
MVLYNWRRKHKNHAVVIPRYKQRTDYDCGPASLKMVLAHYGKKVSDVRLRKLCKTSKGYGTGSTAMIKTARKLGFSVGHKNNAKIDDLKKNTLLHHPVIIHYVAWGGGHYSVVIGVSKKHILLADPSKKGVVRTVNRSRFLKYWVDEKITDKHPYRRWMMVVKPRRKKPA